MSCGYEKESTVYILWPPEASRPPRHTRWSVILYSYLEYLLCDMRALTVQSCGAFKRMSDISSPRSHAIIISIVLFTNAAIFVVVIVRTISFFRHSQVCTLLQAQRYIPTLDVAPGPVPSGGHIPHPHPSSLSHRLRQQKRHQKATWTDEPDFAFSSYCGWRVQGRHTTHQAPPQHLSLLLLLLLSLLLLTISPPSNSCLLTYPLVSHGLYDHHAETLSRSRKIPVERLCSSLIDRPAPTPSF